MTTEARTFVSDLVWNDGNFMTLFTANYGYVSPELARIYGVPAPAKDFDRVPFPAGSERAGILGQGLVSGADRETRRFVAHRARPVCAGAVPLPACAGSAAGREHESSAGDGSQAANQSRSHVGTHHQCHRAPPATS